MPDEKKSFRILCVGGHRSPSNAWRRVLTFRKMGHVVESLDTTNFGYFKIQLLRRLALGPGLPLVRFLLTRKLQGLVHSFKPEVIFFEKSTWLRPVDLKRLRKAGPEGMKLVHYNPDDPFGHFSKGWASFIDAIPYYDVHFVPKPENVDEYKQRGAKSVHSFDRAYDPDLHRPVALTDEEKQKYGCDVGFIGAYAQHREEVIADLIQSGIPIAIWGNGWQWGRNWDIVKPHFRGPGQYDEDYVKAICGMKISLHFLRRENRDEQDSRTFEIPACGTFMLAERTKTHERLFEDGKEAVFFDGLDDLRAKIDRFLSAEDERARIASQGLERCKASGYDHSSRLNKILSEIFNNA